MALDVLEPTGRTRESGKEYRCRLCGDTVWSNFGNHERHAKACLKAHTDGED